MAIFSESNSSGSTKGFVWVRRSVPNPAHIRLGFSAAPPANELNVDSRGQQWVVEYYSLVDDMHTAFEKASAFLSSFIEATDDDGHLYRAHAVVAATAIETSGVNIRFRKSTFAAATRKDETYQSIAKSGFPEDHVLRDTLENSVKRRRRVDTLISEIESIEAVLIKSERVTNNSAGAAAGMAAASEAVMAVSRQSENAAIQAAQLASTSDAAIPTLFRDKEPDTLVRLEGPDDETVKRMEFLILRREASQNLRRIRFGYAASFLKGIPLGATLGFGALLVMNRPADIDALVGFVKALPQSPDLLLQFVAAGTIALPIMLLGYRLIRSWNDASYWRSILRA